MTNVLVLGGTTEASALAKLLGAAGIAATLSYAGRTAAPLGQPVPVRVGGFGGADGLADYMRAQRITHLVDATHPFAATMSAHAVLAAKQAGVPLVALTRPPWTPIAGDSWSEVATIPDAVAALAGPPRRVMLALGRMHVGEFAAQPQHHYLLRFVDPPVAPVPLPDHTLIVDRGPFTVEGDTRLLGEHAIELVVCKNAGGAGAEAKLTAARALGLPVMMVARPHVPARAECFRPEDVLAWLGHGAPSAKRGV